MTTTTATRRRAAAGATVLAIALVGCAVDPAAEPGGESCHVATRVAAVQAADRKLIGAASPYPADGALRGREDELVRSQRLRRQVGWHTVAKILATVELAEPLPSLAGVPAAIPRWHTWYGRDDLSRLFHRLYEGLDADARGARERFADSALDDAFAWNPRAVEELANWPEERWLEYVEAIDEQAEVAGVGGIGRVSYDPAASRHVLASYPDILRCMEGEPPGAFADGPVAGPRRMVREPIVLSGCQTVEYGPYFVAGDETLRAALDGDPGGMARISVRRSAPAGAVECHAPGDQPCEVPGPGGFYVAVRSGPDAVAAALTVDYHQARPDWSACLAAAFPVAGAVVKADWRRAQFGQTLAVHDTSAAALAARLADDSVEWGAGQGQADPQADEIYTVRVANGQVYRLAGLHIMTKELDHWLWITLWWSPDPDGDFGADRPPEVAALGAPWRNYKMCTAVSFAERDPDPGGGFAGSAPSLADALAAVHRGDGGPSWCSNPYLEVGAGNAATNCVGCHQHAFSGLRSEDLLGDPARFPHHGRTLLRNNFPADYLWSIDTGDRIGLLFADVVEYYDAAP